MRNLQFTPHSGETCPVYSGTFVVYRTTSDETPISHVHMPIEAGSVNWSSEPEIGKILNYAVVNNPKPPGFNTKQLRSRGRVKNEGIQIKDKQ